MKQIAIGLVVGALLLSVGQPAVAQQEEVGGRYTFTVVAARTMYDESSALQDAWTGGLEAEYNIQNWIALGGYLMAARPSTDGDFFPLVRLEFQDTVFLQTVSQQMTQIDYGAQVSFRAALDRFFFRGIGGVGGYVFNLDDARIATPAVPGTIDDKVTGLAWNIGAMVGYRFGRTGSVEFRVRDFIYTDFDRDKFAVSEPLLGAPDIPHPAENLPEKKATIHNIQLQLGFSFTVGGA
jgi:hypothetical protein